MLALAVTTGCATTRGSDRILGLVLLEGTQQPITGATLTLTPIAPLPMGTRSDPSEDPLDHATEAMSENEGAFSFLNLATSAGPPHRLLRGWEYELRCDAPGFYSGVERVDYTGGEEAVVIEIDVIEDELVQGDGGLFVGEQPPDRIDEMKGTLIKEVLRRLGREAPENRPLN